MRDNAGNIAKAVILVAAAALDPSTGAVNAIATAIAAISAAISPRQETGSQDGESPGDVGDGPYSATEDRMDLTYLAADGSTGTFEIPAPLATNFNADRTTVNMTDSNVVALVTELNKTVTPFGQSLQVIRGIRSRKKQMKV